MRIFEDFIDNVEKDDIVSTSISNETEQYEIKYAIFASVRPKLALSKMLKKTADSFFEVKYSEVKNFTVS